MSQIKFTEEWLKDFRAKLTALFYDEKSVYLRFLEYIQAPGGHSLVDSEELIKRGIIDMGGQPSIERIAAFDLMTLNPSNDPADYPLTWLPAGSRPNCVHGPWRYTGIWHEGVEGGPHAFCTSCGDHKRFTWDEWMRLDQSRRQELSGSR